MNIVHDIMGRAVRELQTFEGWARLIVTLCMLSVLAAVFMNFQLAQNSRAIRAKRKSIVETGSMLGFLAGFYLLIRFRVGVYDLPVIYYPGAVIGLVLVVIGAVVNITGRFALGKNWGNQVIIYEDHSLVTKGIYRVVRHPLYASLIWMFLGAALVFQNGLALLAALMIFIPGMFYRAKQEEKALLVRFPDYQKYRNTVGMFFPISMGPETVMVSRQSFAFCRISLTAILWLALVLHNLWLVVAVFALLSLSVILKVQRSPMIQLYRQTIQRLFPAQKFEMLDVAAMRFAHGTGALMSLVVILAILTSPAIGWCSLLAFCVIKTISAFGFCPASKLFVCMRNGGCCALTRAVDVR